MLSDADRGRFKQDVAKNARSSTVQLANWIADARRVTEMVAGGDRDVIPVFWIRLFGLLADIADYVADQVEALKHSEIAEAALVNPSDIQPLLGALERLRDVFDEDEVIYLQYRRHVDSHPLQDAYRIKIRKGRLTDKVNHRLLGQQMTVDETEAAIRRVLRAYSVQESAIAHRFAERALSAIEDVRNCSLQWFGEATAAHEARPSDPALNPAGLWPAG